MKIIPAIDVIDGKAVRLKKGDYATKTIYNEHPEEVAMQFADAGLTRLHLVDLDGAKAGHVKNWKVLEKIATKTKLEIDFSGGISSEQDVQITFDSGAKYVSVGSIAVKKPNIFQEWLNKFGVENFILGADVKDEKIMIKGWTEATNIDVFNILKHYRSKGLEQFFCTDISRDGLLQGSSNDLYKKIIERVEGMKLIASGGVSSIKDLEELRDIGCHGAIIGKAIYENIISLKELKQFNN
ncbi:MAG TPA: 1-(5-phosphoribosyl)-5-[(5-phosphoribosylamino)methylideneamino]imidazole-4-carboxamide isomerase [Niabella sp.]|jgi:phosphoribosylformimino-5-aminoimidazole carboxamide ribotide isomerase|nr:1-(5-phosphoribosyl)-5-[(5-phosphoribosylamino)methylideneamino]imidazole-4-carboxamide isomerase [Chitinophagaceae bacterium]HRO84848.1 1-(5-phosphoribosyl)-5-[(5-phosphoribosylamino)methylideneamino]imidazole-4-carboxamide isomerase [Niabella sp.]